MRHYNNGGGRMPDQAGRERISGVGLWTSLARTDRGGAGDVHARSPIHSVLLKVGRLQEDHQQVYSSAPAR